ncbi:MAG: phenylacetate-CoA oxygenase subunit PaaJ [Acidobacteria bacterium]|nr:MAG: phenylacetate-CoA oxygenase subunit PaaJ [Acidobacteriota bacterium]
MELLSGIPDPEIPVLDIVELGIVRAVRLGPEGVEVDITPTYSGCPALEPIREQIVRVLEAGGFSPVRVNTVHAPAWTTDAIGQEAREKLRRYGIAPPEQGRGPVPCPSCGSSETVVRSEFGSTPCKSLLVCRSCQEPFEHFKCHR